MGGDLRMWAIARDDYLFSTPIFQTRDEVIRFECWNLWELQVREDYRGLSPWRTLDPEDVSRAWRRIKRKYGLRAVRVRVTPEDTP